LRLRFATARRSTSPRFVPTGTYGVARFDTRIFPHYLTGGTTPAMLGDGDRSSSLGAAGVTATPFTCTRSCRGIAAGRGSHWPRPPAT
jgi:hypothetical protein